MNLRRLLLSVALLLCSVTGLVARADQQHAALIPPQLVGNYDNRDALRVQAIAKIRERLRAAHLLVLSDDVLAPIDNDCHDQECLSQILEAYSVQVAVLTRITRTDGRNAGYQIHLLIELHPFSASASDAATVQLRDKSCPKCSEQETLNTLGGLIDEVVSTIPAPPVVPEPEQVEVSPEPVASAEREVIEPLPSLSPWADKRHAALRITALVDGVGAIAFLGVGFSELAHDHDRVDKSGNGCSGGAACAYQLETRRGQAVFFTLGAVFAVGATVSAILGWLPAPQHSPALLRIGWAPTVSRDGAGLTLSGKF